MTMLFTDYPKGAYLDCEFIDRETDEVFLVELPKREKETPDHFIKRCKAVASEYFEEFEFVRFVDPEEAEMLGYDTY